MAITALQDLKFVQLSTPTQGDLTLSESVTASATSFTVNFEPKNEDGTAITKDWFLEMTSTISGKRYTETILCTAVSGTTLTVVRGIDRGGLDYSGSASNAIAHQGGTVIKANLPAGLFQSHDSALKGEIGTGATHMKIGTGADVNSGIKAYNADVNKPYVEYDAATNQWIASNDGTTSFVIGTGAGAITGGDGITVTAGDIDIDLTDTVIFKNARTGNEIRVPITAVGDGKLDKTFMPTYVEDLINSGTTVAEIDQALDGISANVTASNLGTLTGAGNATALHTHTAPKCGTTTRAGDTASGTQNIAHGLGVVPRLITIHAAMRTNTSNSMGCICTHGSYNGTTQGCAGTQADASHTYEAYSATQIIYLMDTAGSQVATVTVDATNIILAFTKSGTTSAGTLVMNWTAQ